eukprot:CAMPEP_0177652564 /NCGR_PEP_ID=MMETSP0447-20121125/13205_1 /TAXON_ID=0 /ORGANISM="Stygamoeba regulata, Strain BSH-02190019" /LENGTH=334 /DNA_ID=CAMNT_0019155833 /DNA_START=28 /DNA_END=1032 /DNA_ORIENTATION=-
MADQQKFADLCKKSYKEQAIWFLNGFWNDGADPDFANIVWKWVKEFIKLDNMSTDPKGAAGNELDQFWSAKFLEDNDEPMTQTAKKEALRAIDTDNNGKMALLEYLIWKKKKTPSQCATAPQGSLTEAEQREMEAAQASMEKLAQALESLKRAEEELRAKKAELDKTVADLKALEKAQQDAADAFAAEEQKYKGECDRLRALSEDASTSAVQRSKANVQLQALLQEDPLPLRKAKITQEAVVRRVQKEQAPLLADLARQKEEVSAKQDAVVSEQQQVSEQMDAARAKIEKLKAMGGVARGALWWMEREMFEADERLARAKQKYDHSKPFYYNPE